MTIAFQKYWSAFCMVILTAILMLNGKSTFAQEDEEYWKSQLDTVVEVVNPVYKPVISIGTGVMSFWGDVRNSATSPINGNFGYKANLSALIGKNNFFKVNVFAIYGKLEGHNFDISRQMQLQPLPVDDNNDPIYPNSSFQTDFFQIGLSFEYNFGHLMKSNAKRFNPFIAVGLSSMFFSPKGNLKFSTGSGTYGYYHFWSDGTMRDYSENGPDAWRANIKHFDNDYETDLSSADLYGDGTYTQRAFVIPADFGFDFYLSDRVNFRIGASVNYAFSDMLDNYSSDIAKKKGYPTKNNYNDIFTFTYFSMNFDLFSDPKSLLVERVFAAYGGEFDYEVFFADEDNDQVFDKDDLCPDTPEGVAVDSVGCPSDSDNDGIFDYADVEPNTPEGAIVDEHGAQLSTDALSAMFDNINAVSRKEIRLIPLANIWTRNVTFTPGVIPDKFRAVDSDADGYISFQELLKTIDDYFDEKTNFKPEDIYELNDYFFTQ
ncbi:MAG: hypothetical protein AB7S54_02225 [Bacteroidales bacterium]